MAPLPAGATTRPASVSATPSAGIRPSPETARPSFVFSTATFQAKTSAAAPEGTAKAGTKARSGSQPRWSAKRQASALAGTAEEILRSPAAVA